jgi:CRISPR-associated endonuclease/helicase Cas3
MQDEFEQQYRRFFRHVCRFDAYAFQVRVARVIDGGGNALLRAPTGSGKTEAVLLPFVRRHVEGRGPRRLIYALPLRTLVESIARKAQNLLDRAGLAVNVTVQTGERPEDPFFTLGDIVVTTYDQVLSGLLCDPYGLPDRLANLNAAAVAGNLVVFDEFHLMEPDKAFLTGVAALKLFGPTLQSVWMTATATAPLAQMLVRELNAKEVLLDERDLAALPSVGRVQRRLVTESAPLSAAAVLAHGAARVIAIVNTVERAQQLFDEIRAAPAAPATRVLLHSRFFKTDRKEKEASLAGLFGQTAVGPAVLVATQVIEAGADISCEHLHTEICPISSLVQRAGRCARFAPLEEGAVAIGTVHAHPLPEEASPLPYRDEQLDAARAAIVAGQMTPEVVATWVERAHAGEDAAALSPGTVKRHEQILDCIGANALHRGERAGVSHLIRSGDASIRVLVCGVSPERPGLRESVALRRDHVRSRLRPHIEAGAKIGWAYRPGEDPAWTALDPDMLTKSYAVCVRPEFARYDSEIGLRLGDTGVRESPLAEEPKRPGAAVYREEPWVDHIRLVAKHADDRAQEELRVGSPLGRTATAEALRRAARAAAVLHDVGKLQVGWQAWAARAQRSRDPSWAPRTPLAHTDFDPSRPDDRERERALGGRPPHSPAGAYVGALLVADLLPTNLDGGARAALASAVLAAVLAHHGGWLPRPLPLQPLVSDWRTALSAFMDRLPEDDAVALWLRHPDAVGALERCLDVATGPEALDRWWPTVAWLTRTLRLSDQGATKEGSCDA